MTITKRQIKTFTNNVIDIPDELDVIESTEVIPSFFRSWRIVSAHDGDKRVVWDSTSLAQMSEAAKLFDKLREEGLEAYRVGIDGKRSSDKMEIFDPEAEEVIFIPMAAMAGG